MPKEARHMALPSYAVDFRGHPACPCLAKWLPVYEAELQRRGVLDGPLKIYQLIGGAEASGGTHASGGAFDITDLVDGGVDVWVARQMGAPATWARTRAQGFVPHLHGVLRGCPHNGPAAYQITSWTLGVEAGWNGLSGDARGRDDGPRPIPNRTWREGIAWAKDQGDDMPGPSEWTNADWEAFDEKGAPAVAKALLSTKIDLGKPGPTNDRDVEQILRELWNNRRS